VIGAADFRIEIPPERRRTPDDLLDPRGSIREWRALKVGDVPQLEEGAD
jgi:hypothetical protein